MLTDDMLFFIKQEADKLEFGRIILEIQKTSDKIDVIIEKRKRFYKEEDKK